MNGSGIGILLFLLLVGGLIGDEILARLLPRWGHPRGKSVVRTLMLVGFAMYVAILLTVSLTSRERVLAHGERLAFCGFYLDCHMGVAVEGVERRAFVGDARAEGIYHLVAVKVSSDARQAALQLARPEFSVIDASGRTYSRSPEAEEQLVTLTGDSIELVRPVPAGESYLTWVVFDLPGQIQEPRLLVRDVSGVDRVLEAILIGDEDSILHKPTTLSLQ